MTVEDFYQMKETANYTRNLESMPFYKLKENNHASQYYKRKKKQPWFITGYNGILPIHLRRKISCYNLYLYTPVKENASS